MATRISERLAKVRQDTPLNENIVTALRPWRRKLFLQRALRWLMNGAIAGLVVGCVLLTIAHIVPWATAIYWAVGSAIACFLMAVIAVIWYRPSFGHTARSIDHQLDLQDRLSTAWELREHTSALATLQRRDALQQLRQFTPAAISLRFSRITLLVLVVAAVGLFLLIYLPNPMNALLQQQGAFNNRIANQITAIQKIRDALKHDNNQPLSQQDQINQILKDLQNQLQKAKNDTEAQQAIANAQSRLDQLRNPQAGNRAQGTNAASQSLEQSNNSSLQQIGQSLANNDSKNLSSTLQNLASQLDKMTSAQRSQLAQQLEQAANQAAQNQNQQLSSALHQLAKSIIDNNKDEVNDAANALQSVIAQNSKDQAQNKTINDASNNLQQIANDLASAADDARNLNLSGQQGPLGPSGQQGGQPGKIDQGNTGQKDQNGSGGQGDKNGQNGGNGGQNNGGKNNAGNNQGKSEEVYIPGQISAGGGQTSPDNNNGDIVPGDSVPYSQVIEKYTQMAHDAIDNSTIPPDTKDLIREYFNELSGQGQ